MRANIMAWISAKKPLYIVILVLAIVSVVFARHSYNLNKALEQEKYLHSQSLESMSDLVQYYCDYAIQLENILETWQARYYINY